MYMRKININNKLFSLIENQKYILAQKKYPEINKIFDISNYDLSFIESNCAHNYLKNVELNLKESVNILNKLIKITSMISPY